MNHNSTMPASLEIDYASRSEAGRKPDNADACDARAPDGELLRTKGVAAAIADGVSTSEGGREAAEVCVTSFLSDYFSTPESWTVKTSASKVLGAINRWLIGQGNTQFDSPLSMLTTFSGLLIKSGTAHVVHVGDSRIYHYRDGELEQLTSDHRVWAASDREFLTRAMGADPHLEIDYRSVAVEAGDIFLFTTDGAHSYLTHRELVEVMGAPECSLQSCANTIVEKALANGSTDNVTCQLLRVLSLPDESEDDIFRRVAELPFPPNLYAGVRIDDYEILRELHASRRSEVFLARDLQSGGTVVLKTPSINYREEAEYLDAFLHEEWVGRRVNDAHVLKVLETRRRRFLYNISEYIEGQALGQWMADNGRADLAQVRDFAAQIAAGLRALHHLEMYHQDLKPDNVLIDRDGTLKLIDFGSTRVAGMGEIKRALDGTVAQGTLNYAAPECLRGDICTRCSDLYSLGVIVYELLTGKLPYGECEAPSSRRRAYTPVTRYNNAVPAWVDGAIAKAVHQDPARRYEALSEFLYDLNHPNSLFLRDERPPLIERNPLKFWQAVAAALLLVNLVLLYLLL